MNVDKPPRVDYESREKCRKTPSVTCAKRTKWRVYRHLSELLRSFIFIISKLVMVVEFHVSLVVGSELEFVSLVESFNWLVYFYAFGCSHRLL